MRGNVYFLVLFIGDAASFKFLAYNPLIGRSHVTFIGKIADLLVNAGHEVVMLVPFVSPTSDFYGSTKLYDAFSRMRAAQCNATVHHPGLMEQLRAEKFDVAFAEQVDLCGFGSFSKR